MVRRRVWSRKLMNEEVLAHWGLSCQKKEGKKKNKLGVRVVTDLIFTLTLNNKHKYGQQTVCFRSVM